jgi:hypothetical protein
MIALVSVLFACNIVLMVNECSILRVFLSALPGKKSRFRLAIENVVVISPLVTHL